MRTQSWRKDLDQIATLDSYRKAKQDGATELAKRIRVANSDGPWNLTNEFDLIDKQLALIPVTITDIDLFY